MRRPKMMSELLGGNQDVSPDVFVPHTSTKREHFMTSMQPSTVLPGHLLGSVFYRWDSRAALTNQNTRHSKTKTKKTPKSN